MIRVVAIFLFGFLLMTNVMAAPLRVAVLAEEGSIYRRFVQALTTQIDPNQFALTVVSPSAAIFPANTELVLAVGAQSTAIALTSRFKVLSVLISRMAYEQLLRELPADALNQGNHAAIYLDQPYERQLSLIAAALPKLRRVGVLYSTAPVEMERLRQVARAKNLNLWTKNTLAGDKLHTDLDDTLKQSEVLLALPDASVYNSFTIRNVLLETYRAHIPVIGFSAALVRAGALMAVFSSPEQIATQTIDVLNQFISAKYLPRSQYPRYFEVFVNQEVAHSLNLTLPEAVNLHAEIVRGGVTDD